MRRLLWDALEGDVAVVQGERLHYLLRVLRLGPGDPLELFDGKGGRRPGTISSITQEEARIELGPWQKEQTQARITLGQALVKSDKFEWVVQKATELGVSRLSPLALSRCVVRLDAEKGAERARRWRKIVEGAARQSDRADVPEVDEPSSLISFLEGAKARGESVALLWEEEREELRLGDWIGAQGDSPVALIVGPEGGISSEEVEEAKERGAAVVGLGPRILRTETAGVVALSIVLHHRGELG